MRCTNVQKLKVGPRQAADEFRTIIVDFTTPPPELLLYYLIRERGGQSSFRTPAHSSNPYYNGLSEYQFT